MTTPMPIETPIMNIKECAAYLRVHTSTIYRLVRRGQIPFFRIGSDYRFHAGEINDWFRTGTIILPGVSR